MNKKYVLIALGALTLSTIGFVFYLKAKQKKQNEMAAFNFQQVLDYHNDTLTDVLMRRHRSDSGVSDITMEDDFDGTVPHYYRHYQLEEGEIA
jgi:hypothetical protein